MFAEDLVLISQGAEGRVYTGSLFSRRIVMKDRFSKKYRLPELDKKLNRQRLLGEARCMAKCRKFGILCPCVYNVDQTANKLYMEYIEGSTVKKLLQECSVGDSSVWLPWAVEIGRCIALLHMKADIIHGDLTTSNLMIRTVGVPSLPTSSDSACSISDTLQPPPPPSAGDTPLVANTFEVVFIDFGLGLMKSSQEDKAVDLYVLERAFASTHPGMELFMSAVLESYFIAAGTNGKVVKQKLDAVHARGRKRDMIG